MFTTKPGNLKVTQLNTNKYRLSEGIKTLIVEKRPYNTTVRFGRYTVQQYEDGFDVFVTTPWTQIGSYEFSDTNAQFYQSVNPRSSRELQISLPIQKKTLRL